MPTPDPVSGRGHRLPTDADVMRDPLGWYEAWRAQRDGRAAAEAALRRRLNRQILWISWFIVGWTTLVCGATAWVIWAVV